MADRVFSGSLAADNAVVAVDTGQNTAYSAVVTGTFVGTVTLQVIYDGTEGWVNAGCFTRAGVSATATLTAVGNRLINTAGALSVRALMHPYTSGTATVTLAGVAATNPAQSGALGGAVTIADGGDVAQGTTTDAGIITDVSGTVIGFLRGAIKQWITFLSRLPAALVGGRLDVNLGAAPATITANSTLQAGTATAGNVGGIDTIVSATFTRPADTTAYTANDAICNSTSAPAALTFANAALSSGHGGFIVGATIIDEANQATTLNATLHLFSAVPATLTNDNAGLALANVDLANYIGNIKFTQATVTNVGSGASGSVALTGTIPNGSLPYKCAATSLFGVLQAGAAYTPVSAEQFICLLNLSQDA
jgi:hypothetical protein